MEAVGEDERVVAKAECERLELGTLQLGGPGWRRKPAVLVLFFLSQFSQERAVTRAFCHTPGFCRLTLQFCPWEGQVALDIDCLDC